MVHDSKTSQSGDQGLAPGVANARADEQLEQLRALLLSEDRQELEQLRRSVEELLKAPKLDKLEVAKLLPAAIDLSSAKSDALGKALTTPVSVGLKQSIESEPKYYGDILYPVLAPAIRKAISQAMSSMLATVQRTLESTTTASGISLRIRSLSSGIPYAELALLKSLVFKVEHVYLIERDTGMLIEQLSDRTASSLDSDAVGAMFSAIESFVSDSFAGEQGDRLTDLKVGERTVWVAHGPKLMLACVIFGDAPRSLQTDLHDTLEQIRVAYAPQLNQASGEALELPEVEKFLEPILQSELKEGKQAKKTNFATLILACAAVALAFYFGLSAWMAKLEYESVQKILAEHPGMVVTQIEKNGSDYTVRGLRDAAIPLPEEQLSLAGVSLDQLVLRTKPFLSLEPQVEIIRFHNQLQIPAGVDLVVVDEGVRLIGSAPLEWAEKHTAELLALARDNRLSLSEFEVSVQSIRETLVADFDEATLAGVMIETDTGGSLNTSRLSGELRLEQKRRLGRYFANSAWVYVEVEPDLAVEAMQPSAAAN